MRALSAVLDVVKFDEKGLVAAVVQESSSGELLMLAWMNRESLSLTVEKGVAVFWSRSRRKLWRKGEQSGHVQIIKDIRLDCDGDALLLIVEQQGGVACHTGRKSCFYRELRDNQWVAVDPVLKDPKQIYG